MPNIEGNLTLVGFWTGPYSHIFPVFEWDEVKTLEQLNQYINKSSEHYVNSTPLPLSYIKNTLYGNLLVSALEIYVNYPVDRNEIWQFDNNQITEELYSTKVSGSNSINQFGSITIRDTSPSSNKLGFEVGHYHYESPLGDTINDYSRVDDNGTRTGILLLRIIDNENTIIFRCNATLYFNGAIISGQPAEYGAKIYFRPYNSASQLLTWFFGLQNQIVTSSPSGEFTPGTVAPTPNPYEPGGDSGEGGGGGNFDDNSDPIPDSSLPTISSANTGFTRIYNPSLSQVQALARYLWTDESVIQTIWNHIKQYFENPMEAIIGFNLVPVPVPDGGTQNFALMYIDTGVSMTVAANQFVDVDCGTLEITPYYGSALDYSPYTKISCFLPFIGTVQLNVDEVMNTTLQVKYRVDICSGSCVAKILVNGNVLYQYSGHCAINIPISAADFSSYVTASISVAKLAIGAAVGGGMGALMGGGDNPVQQTNQVVTTTQVTNTARNPNTGRQITTGTQTTVQTVERPNDQSSTQGSYAGLVPENITNTVGQIMSSKPHVEHSGSFSGNTGYLGVRRPYVIIQRPNMCMPSQYQAFNGFPSMITLSLGECKGFTKVQQVQLTGFYATNPEQAEILQLLKSGVIL